MKINGTNLRQAYLEDPELSFSLCASLVAITSSSFVYRTVAVVSPIFQVPSYNNI